MGFFCANQSLVARPGGFGGWQRRTWRLLRDLALFGFGSKTCFFFFARGRRRRRTAQPFFASLRFWLSPPLLSSLGIHDAGGQGPGFLSRSRAEKSLIDTRTDDGHNATSADWATLGRGKGFFTSTLVKQTAPDLARGGRAPQPWEGPVLRDTHTSDDNPLSLRPNERPKDHTKTTLVLQRPIFDSILGSWLPSSRNGATASTHSGKNLSSTGGSHFQPIPDAAHHKLGRATDGFF